MELLKQQKCGSPIEHFYHLKVGGRILTLESFYEKGLLNNVFGTAIHQIHYQSGMQRLKELSGMVGQDDFEVLNALCPGIQFIYLYRHDKIKQAVSLKKSMRSGHFLFKENPEFGKYSEKDITQALALLCKSESRWFNFFTHYKIKPYYISYEELCSDTIGSIRGILDFLQLDSSNIQVNSDTLPKSQYDETSENWYKKYLYDNDLFLPNITKV